MSCRRTSITSQVLDEAFRILADFFKHSLITSRGNVVYVTLRALKYFVETRSRKYMLDQHQMHTLWIFVYVPFFRCLGRYVDIVEYVTSTRRRFIIPRNVAEELTDINVIKRIFYDLCRDEEQ